MEKFDLDGVVVDAAALPLAALDAVELVGLAHLRAHEAVVGDFAVGHPDREDRAAGDAALEPGLAALPAPAGINELAVVDLRALHQERPDAGPEGVLDAQVMQMERSCCPSRRWPRAVAGRAGSGRRW